MPKGNLPAEVVQFLYEKASEGYDRYESAQRQAKHAEENRPLKDALREYRENVDAAQRRPKFFDPNRNKSPAMERIEAMTRRLDQERRDNLRRQLEEEAEMERRRKKWEARLKEMGERGKGKGGDDLGVD